MDKNVSDTYLLGKKLIESAINMDQALVQLLKTEVANMKKLVKDKGSMEDLKKINTVVKSIILAMIMTDEKIKSGMVLCDTHDRKSRNQ